MPARLASVHHTTFSVSQAILASSIVLESARFRFGAALIQDLTRGPSPFQHTSSTIQAMTALSLRAERDLTDTLLSFSNPADLEEQTYIRDWGRAVYSFDPADVPSDTCLQLPTFQDEALIHTPFSHPTPIPVTRWIPRKPRQQFVPCPNVTTCADLILPMPHCAGRLTDWWEQPRLTSSCLLPTGL